MILVTDGVVHDIPASAAQLGFRAPLHALVTGHPNERDRQIKLIEAPRFGIVGKDQTIRAQVMERGGTGSALVTVRRDGQPIVSQRIATGRPFSLPVRIEHGGPNVVEIEAEALPDELTRANNRAVLTIEGIREKLRVLLVSGEPHAGERTWRNLLKSDANVDLVHFTILRPPEKQDGTPINELSLIAFPTRELFQQKIKEFDLIIFDRYANQSVLPSAYFDNIVRYVREGGAVLVAAGPEFAGGSSLARTRLAPVIPGDPDGRVFEEAYKARVTGGGRRHPVTRDLPGAEADPPAWGEWLRLVGARIRTGATVMSGAGDQPLLVLAREDKGRVALLLSDQAWLWARGYREGGPHLDLLRRLAHWLMKEPALEEEALRASVTGREIRIERQTLATAPTRSRSRRRAAPSARSRSPRSAPACSPPRCRAARWACTPCAPATSSPSSASVPRTRASSSTCSATPRRCARSPRRPAAPCAASPRTTAASRCRASKRCAPDRASPAATGSASVRATARSCAASRCSRWRSASSASRSSSAQRWRLGWPRGGAGGRGQAARSSRRALCFELNGGSCPIAPRRADGCGSRTPLGSAFGAPRFRGADRGSDA